MKKLFAVGAVMFLAGCASHPIKNTVEQNIDDGDSSAKVISLLGEPDYELYDKQTQGALDWYYSKRADQCEVTVKDHKVLGALCWDNGDYVSPGRKIARAVGTVLKGAGEGVSRGGYQGGTITPPSSPAPQQLNCSTYQFGYALQTSCTSY